MCGGKPGSGIRFEGGLQHFAGGAAQDLERPGPGPVGQECEGATDGAAGQARRRFGDLGRDAAGLHEERGDVVDRQSPDAHGKEPCPDGREQRIGFGGREDDRRVGGGLLEQLEECVGRFLAGLLRDESLRVADDEDLARADRGPRLGDSAKHLHVGEEQAYRFIPDGGVE